MPRRRGAVQRRRGGVLGLLGEPTTYRLYHCRRCRMQVCICAACDHGNLYCAAECSRLARRECVRRAGERYQSTLHGAQRHAERQRRYRERREKVTHHRFSELATACSVSAPAAIASESTDAEPDESARGPIRRPQSRCAFCGTVLPAFARLHPWRWSG
jgi:hypothetical protein